MLMQIVQQAKANNVPPEQLTDLISKMEPGLKMQLSEETAAMRASLAETSGQVKVIMAALAAKKVDETGRHDRVMEDNSTQRIQVAKEKAASGGAPTKSELNDPDIARVFWDKYKVDRVNPPFSMGKAGEADREAWFRAVAKFSKEDGLSGGEVAGGQADGRANSAALTQNTKDIASIRPYKEMLDKNANIAIDLSKKVALTNSAWANRPVQWLRANGTSDPNLREYLAQIQIVSTEAARVLNNPRLTGQLTDSARHEMQEIINGKMPLADTERVLKRMMQDGDNRVTSLQTENASLKRGASGKSGDAPAKGGGDTNAKGWKLHTDKDGNKAYVSPDGKQFEEVK